MNSQINNTRESIHSGLSGLKNDAKWSEMLNLRSRDSRTKVLPMMQELFSKEGGFHTLVRGLNNKNYVLGSEKSYLFTGGDSPCLYPLWAIREEYLGARNERSSSEQRLILRGNFNGSRRKTYRVSLVKGRLVADKDWPEEEEEVSLFENKSYTCPCEDDDNIECFEPTLEVTRKSSASEVVFPHGARLDYWKTPGGSPTRYITDGLMAIIPTSFWSSLYRSFELRDTYSNDSVWRTIITLSETKQRQYEYINEGPTVGSGSLVNTLWIGYTGRLEYENVNSDRILIDPVPEEEVLNYVILNAYKNSVNSGSFSSTANPFTEVLLERDSTFGGGDFNPGLPDTSFPYSGALVKAARFRLKINTAYEGLYYRFLYDTLFVPSVGAPYFINQDQEILWVGPGDLTDTNDPNWYTDYKEILPGDKEGFSRIVNIRYTCNPNDTTMTNFGEEVYL